MIFENGRWMLPSVFQNKEREEKNHDEKKGKKPVYFLLSGAGSNSFCYFYVDPTIDVFRMSLYKWADIQLKKLL